ncbi:hypothetical protein MLP_19850 [Microlunatus phosphovorus NM-1]|uniref:Carboxyltransferase domain-containing protein n=1 Tax=Microlunatus phosphovorus (strain ATCC 700054 / DSM 10555 / JCM 9379 / NBRC 101784 / NCIMB 13414 / VKM Ac-1990 / NM-1) TaxID=1032480 RepID=F5XTC7_MICPN|nr:hypothetical protein MLP_19850 [Microlunatus phosphovorus NM-1]
MGTDPVAGGEPAGDHQDPGRAAGLSRCPRQRTRPAPARQLRTRHGAWLRRGLRGRRVGPSSNHIGLRLGRTDQGPIPHRQTRTEVLSRGVPIGAVEVPAGDEILILHRGRGVTAGYPVLAVVTTVGLSRLGQARPGDTVRFRPVSTATAIADLRRQQAHLHDVGTRVRTAFTSLASLNSPTRSPLSAPQLQSPTDHRTVGEPHELH